MNSLPLPTCHHSALTTPTDLLLAPEAKTCFAAQSVHTDPFLAKLEER